MTRGELLLMLLFCLGWGGIAVGAIFLDYPPA